MPWRRVAPCLAAALFAVAWLCKWLSDSKGQLAWDPTLACSEAWRTRLLWRHSLAVHSDRRDLGFLHSPTFCAARHTAAWRPHAYLNASAGPLVLLHARHLRAWTREVLPALASPFALATLGDDAGVPRDFLRLREAERLLAHPALAGWWSTNPTHPRVRALPLGLDLHDQATHAQLIRGFRLRHLLRPWGLLAAQRSPQAQEEWLLRLVGSLPPTRRRRLYAWADFQFDQDNPSRQALWRQIEAQARRGGPIRAPAAPMRRHDLFRLKSQYMFDLSPPGHGEDCYRTWESLVLGMVPIVLAGTSLDRGGLYEGLPVVRVRNFSEVTVDNLRVWAREVGRHASRRKTTRLALPDGQEVEVLEQLTTEYWVQKLRSAALRHKVRLMPERGKVKKRGAPPSDRNLGGGGTRE